MDQGCIKLFRRILQSQVFAHQTALKIWVWCLCKATFRERFVSLKIGKGETTVKLLPGQFLFGRFKAEEELGIDGSTIYKWIQKFASPEFGMITIESNNQYSVITLCNWEQYQILEKIKKTTIEQPHDNHVAAEEQPRNTNNNDNNVNNVKNDNKEEQLQKNENEFKQSVFECDPLKYSQELCDKFINYWTEKNTKGKMRFELEKVFEISKRLAYWKSRNDKTKQIIKFTEHDFKN